MQQTTPIPIVYRIIILWILITLGMLFHQFFSLHNLRFGVNVVKEGYEGAPSFELTKRLAFYVLPLIYIAITLFTQKMFVRVLHLIAASIYSAFHIWHFFHEWGKMTDPVQWVLLSTLIVLPIILVYSSYRWIRIKN